jgi:acetyl-CoA carboxylase biotin carboxylase subunit
MFQRVLIANRGEIACRVARSCRRLGITSIAVYSDADASAAHVRAADLAAHVGPPPVAASYLNIEAILEAAHRLDADAIHPGYGLLSENAAFAEAVQRSGICFVGPSPESIRVMGDKSRARSHVRSAGVPVIPGTEDTVQSGPELQRLAGEVGFPLMVKASAGGGGIGMTIVRSPEQLETAIERAGRTAARSFGSAHVYLERYLQGARHIEVQVFGDRFGNVIHLGDRECSVQRRHQKILEEAPAPGLPPELRERMAAAAVAAARSVDYVGAGTVEFLVDDTGSFYFLEMNTRLQVEHPVTELVTGLDLVELQLQVAAGEALTMRPPAPSGHAIECRLYAEDPHTHMPSPGVITTWRMPEGDGIRLDAGVEEGSEVTVYYDPLLAKLNTWAEERADAIARMELALDAAEVGGIATNLPLLRRLMRHAEFVEGRYDTGVIGALAALPT